MEHKAGIKCTTFGACGNGKQHLAFGDFAGVLNIVDLETKKIFYSTIAHEKLVNCIDGIGGLDIGYGAPEIVTGGRDGKLGSLKLRLGQGLGPKAEFPGAFA